jgi:hypothetical protein
MAKLLDDQLGDQESSAHSVVDKSMGGSHVQQKQTSQA